MVRLLIVAMLFVLVFPSAGLAWNETGHMTVALIAYRQLDDATRQKVAQLLKAHPHFDLYLTHGRPEGASEEEWAFLRAAVWPDFVRPARPGAASGLAPELFRGPEVTRFHRGAWHVLHMPWIPPSDRKTFKPTTLPTRQATTQPGDALIALQHNSKLLASPQEAPADRAVALAWMGHLVGDLHQPLHACTVYSNAFPGGDNSGSDQAIRENDTVMTLHTYWDSALGTSDAYSAIDFLARQIVNDPQLAREKLTELSSEASFERWAQESHELAIAFAHLNGKLKSVRQAAFDAKEIPPDAVPPLHPSYNGNTREVSKRRVALAGYRLAEQVTRLLQAP